MLWYDDIMQTEEVSLDEMWKAIEQFGLKREMLEDNLSSRQVWELFVSIQNRKSFRT